MSRKKNKEFKPEDRAVGLHASVPVWLDMKCRTAAANDPDPELRGKFSAWIAKLLIDKVGPKESDVNV